MIEPKVGQIWKLKDKLKTNIGVPRYMFIEKIIDNDMRGILVLATRFGYSEKEQFYFDAIVRDCELVSG